MELVFTIAVFEAAGVLAGDRIEHISVASPDLVERIASLGLHACVQPHFIAEHGDRYLADVEPQHIPDLYRLRSLRDAGVILCGGSDAPYGSTDPWSAMRAAVARASPAGVVIGADEALSPEQALGLYCADPSDISRIRTIAVGAIADLCLLDRPWSQARTRLSRTDVRATVIAGALIYERVDQAPLEGLGSTHPPA